MAHEVAVVSDRRTRLIEAATALFAQAPYDRVQVDDIASAANVAKPTLYRYFAGKEALFLAALERGLAGLVAEVSAIAAGSGRASDRLHRVIQTVLPQVRHFKAAIRAVEPHSAGIDQGGRALLRNQLRELRGAVAAVIRAGTAAREFRPCDPDFAALAILGGVRLAAEASTEPDAAERLAEFFIGGLAPNTSHAHDAPEAQSP